MLSRGTGGGIGLGARLVALSIECWLCRNCTCLWQARGCAWLLCEQQQQQAAATMKRQTHSERPQQAKAADTCWQCLSSSSSPGTGCSPHAHCWHTQSRWQLVGIAGFAPRQLQRRLVLQQSAAASPGHTTCCHQARRLGGKCPGPLCPRALRARMAGHVPVMMEKRRRSQVQHVGWQR